ncbi:hypothetical protein AB688_17985 [Pseudomonas putida]|nr:hypothetical protein AB688_17985 [Pseudomonas putida]
MSEGRKSHRTQPLQPNKFLHYLYEFSPYPLSLHGLADGKLMDVKVSTVKISTEKALRAIIGINSHPAHRAFDKLKMSFNGYRGRISEPA